MGRHHFSKLEQLVCIYEYRGYCKGLGEYNSGVYSHLFVMTGWNNCDFHRRTCFTWLASSARHVVPHFKKVTSSFCEERKSSVGPTLRKNCTFYSRLIVQEVSKHERLHLKTYGTYTEDGNFNYRK